MRCVRCFSRMYPEPPDETDRQPGVREVLLCLSCGNRVIVGAAPLADLPLVTNAGVHVWDRRQR